MARAKRVFESACDLFIVAWEKNPGYIARARLRGPIAIPCNPRLKSRELQKRQIPFQRFSFANSAHNVLQDYDRQAASEKIVEVLGQ